MTNCRLLEEMLESVLKEQGQATEHRVSGEVSKGLAEDPTLVIMHR